MEKEASLIPAFYEKFGKQLPQGLWDEHAALVSRLEAADQHGRFDATVAAE